MLVTDLVRAAGKPSERNERGLSAARTRLVTTCNLKTYSEVGRNLTYTGYFVSNRYSILFCYKNFIVMPLLCLKNHAM